MKLSPSDYILIFAYLVILGETVLLSWANMPEIRYLTAHPNYNSIYDPMYIGVSRKDRVAYQKVVYLAHAI